MFLTTQHCQTKAAFNGLVQLHQQLKSLIFLWSKTFTTITKQKTADFDSYVIVLWISSINIIQIMLEITGIF